MDLGRAASDQPGCSEQQASAEDLACRQKVVGHETRQLTDAAGQDEIITNLSARWLSSKAERRPF